MGLLTRRSPATFFLNLTFLFLGEMLVARACLGFLLVKGALAMGPCDIYAQAGTPCVAAHSVVRALFGSFSGSLYQVKRASDNATMDIPVLSPGGVSNATAQDIFCAQTECVIQRLYDQVRTVCVNGVHAVLGGTTHLAELADPRSLRCQ